MRKVILLLTMSWLVLSLGSCDPSKKLAQGDSGSDCKDLEQVKSSFFNELSSADYQLNALRQKGDMMEMDIITSQHIADAHLYWTGAVRKSYPPQAAVKLILNKAEIMEPSNQRKNNKYTFCFDMSSMKTYGDRIKIYIMDDEEAIDLYFKK